jgi:hypothetical protein
MKTPALHSDLLSLKSLKHKVLTLTFLTMLYSTGEAPAVVITWLDSFQGSPINHFFSELDPDLGEVTIEAAGIGSQILIDGAASVTFTTTLNSFSISGNGAGTFVNGLRYLEISGLAEGETLAGEFSFSMLPGFSIAGGYEKWNPNLSGGAWNPPPFFTEVPTTIQLSNGTYLVSLVAGSQSLEPTYLGNGETFASFNVVPEPGSAMLCLVALGLGLRRKRSGNSVRANSHGDSEPMML